MNKQRTITEMCHSGIPCPRITGPILKTSIDGVNTREEGYCTAYEMPYAWYRKGACPLKPAPIVKKKKATVTGRFSKKKKAKR